MTKSTPKTASLPFDLVSRHKRNQRLEGEKLLRAIAISLLIVAALTTSGCRHYGFLVKRKAEECCPTDIRQTVPWCAGEDALFQCPCEPNATFYGYKPTCWGVWPASGAAWRDAHCGEIHHGAIISELTNRNSELIELPIVGPEPEPAPPLELKQPLENSASPSSVDNENESLPQPAIGPAQSQWLEEYNAE